MYTTSQLTKLFQASTISLCHWITSKFLQFCTSSSSCDQQPTDENAYWLYSNKYCTCTVVSKQMTLHLGSGNTTPGNPNACVEYSVQNLLYIYYTANDLVIGISYSRADIFDVGWRPARRSMSEINNYWLSAHCHLCGIGLTLPGRTTTLIASMRNFALVWVHRSPSYRDLTVIRSSTFNERYTRKLRGSI